MEFNDSEGNSNDESATISQDQLDEWAGLSAEEINSDQGEGQSEEIESKDAAELTAEQIMSEANQEGQSEGAEQPSADFDLLKAINDLKPVHNNLPFEVESSKQALELLQKGYDYTRKMQDFSNERNVAYDEYDAKVEELEKSYSEHAEMLNKAQVFDYALKHMEDVNPTLFEEVMAHVNGSTQSFNNPVISSLQNEIAMLKAQVANQTATSEGKSIVQGFERDIADFQKEIGPAVNNLGLKPNWNKVKEIWARDSEGKMSVSEAFYAAHGADIQKLRASKQNVANTQRKNMGARKIPTAGTANSAKGGGTSEDYSGMSLEQAAMKIAFG